MSERVRAIVIEFSHGEPLRIRLNEVGSVSCLRDPDRAMPKLREWMRRGARRSERDIGMVAEFLEGMAQLGVVEDGRIWGVVDHVLNTSNPWVVVDDDDGAGRIEVLIEHAGEGGEFGYGEGRVGFDLAQVLAESRATDEQIYDMVDRVKSLREGNP